LYSAIESVDTEVQKIGVNRRPDGWPDVELENVMPVPSIVGRGI